MADDQEPRIGPQFSSAPFSLRELPRSERPRERLVRLGVGSLSTVELIAIVLGTGTGNRSALALAHHVFSAVGGSLRRLATGSVTALTAVDGIGAARAGVLHAALELGRRMSAEGKGEGVAMRAPRDVYEVFAPRLQDLPVEEFHVAVLNAQQRLERDITVTRGILNSSLVHPREVFREAIAEQAASIILVHNHPSGDPTPSHEDEIITEQLFLAGRLLDVPVQDHVIVGRGRYTSFMESGLLKAT
ncbi:MAG: DNA repair protein RadC [Gemmatimonadaceae bacterium]